MARDKFGVNNEIIAGAAAPSTGLGLTGFSLFQPESSRFNLREILFSENNASLRCQQVDHSSPNTSSAFLIQLV